MKTIYCTRKNKKYFEDYLNSLKNFFTIIYYTDFDVNILVDNKDKQESYFIKEIPKCVEKSNCKYYFINTEQLTRETYRNRVKRTSRKIKTFDYSEENCSINNLLTHLPYQVNFNEIFDYEKTFNICHVGASSKRRKNIIDQLYKNKIKVKNINGWGEKRDELLFRHKILINIHCEDNYNINEQIRINRCIFNKMIVISESGYDDDKLYLKDRMILCPYDELVNTTKTVLENYLYFYEKLFSDFDLNEIDEYYKKLTF